MATRTTEAPKTWFNAVSATENIGLLSQTPQFKGFPAKAQTDLINAKRWLDCLIALYEANASL